MSNSPKKPDGNKYKSLLLSKTLSCTTYAPTINPTRILPPDTCFSTTLAWAAQKLNQTTDPDLLKMQSTYSTWYTSTPEFQGYAPPQILQDLKLQVIEENGEVHRLEDLYPKLQTISPTETLLILLVFKGTTEIGHWIGIKKEPAQFRLFNSKIQHRLELTGNIESVIADINTFIDAQKPGFDECTLHFAKYCIK